VKRCLPLFLLITILWGAAAALAEDTMPPVPVRAVWNVTAIPAGGKAELGVVFDVPKGHHITDVENGLFFVNTHDTLGLKFDSAIFPKGTKYKDDRVYQGKVLVRIPVTAGEDAAVGTISWPVDIGFQICQEFGQEICYLPVEEPVTVTATIAAKGSPSVAANADVFAPPAAASTEETGKQSLDERLIAALNKGSWLAFLLVFLGGILSSFTPCVYPVIPITIGYIGGASKGKPLRGLGLSAIYVLGIAAVYSTLGLVSAASGTLFGTISGSPIVTFVVAGIFAVMGISMLGAFEIALPSSIQSKMQSGSPRKGLLAPFVLGMISGLVIAPCVGPVIVALLAWVSKTGNLFLGWSLLFVFSLGLGVLFLVIGTFAGAIQALPKAGAWMDNIKHGFGWILLAAALYLLRLTIPEPFNSLAWAVLLIIFSVFVGAFDSIHKETHAMHRIWKALTLIIFIVGAIMLFRVFGPAGGVATTGAKSEMSWLVNEEEKALADAASSKKPLLIDVYADWCVACVELDEKTYSVATVQQRTADFVRLKLDFTKETPWVKEMKQKYNITGMPTVILYDPSGAEVSRFTGFKPAGDFVALLDKKGL
jgi:thiol:disulfide interchange protein DsbD